MSKRRRKSLSAARSLLTTYLDNERRPTTRDRATYVVERVEAADGRVVSESEKSLDRPKGGRGQGQMPKTTDHGFGPDARFHRRTQMPKTTQTADEQIWQERYFALLADPIRAAAPDLLEALHIMVSTFNVAEIDPLIAFASIEKARAAIAKAEGRE